MSPAFALVNRASCSTISTSGLRTSFLSPVLRSVMTRLTFGEGGRLPLLTCLANCSGVFPPRSRLYVAFRDVILASNGTGDGLRLDFPFRTFVSNQDELLQVAMDAAGGNLDDLTEIKPGWWQGTTPSGTVVKIEWEPTGHATTDEGPHVTVRELKDPSQGVKGGWKVVRKAFITGQEKWCG